MRDSDFPSSRGRVDFYAARVVGPTVKRYRWVWHRSFPAMMGIGLAALAVALAVVRYLG